MSTTSAALMILFLLAMSAFFSASETSFSLLSRSRIKIMADNGNPKASLVLAMSENYDELLSTILVGNNIVNIAMASIATLWFTSFIKHGGATASTAFTTVAVLVFGEISPKSLAKEAPEKVAMAFAPLLKVFVTIFKPVNWLFGMLKKALSKVVTVKDERKVDGEELLAIVTEAEREGGIDDVESLLIKSAIEFGDHDAMEIATPRVDITAISDDDSAEEIEKIFNETGFSRLPVYSGSIDNIIGILHQKDFLLFRTEWRKGIKIPVFVTETIDIGSLLKLMQRKKSHMAVIVDEFGGTAGIVTMEDILEELVGEIWDEHDETITDFESGENGCVYINGDTLLEDMMDRLGIDTEREFESTSVAGWVMEILERVPLEGDTFSFGGYGFTVIKVSGRRIRRVEAMPLASQE